MDIFKYHINSANQKLNLRNLRNENMKTPWQRM